VQRRFQVRHDIGGIMIVDDYGHHPAEIRATLAAAKSSWSRRVVAVFQPHRFSRTKALFNDFLTAFYQADKLILTDIYAAGEAPLDGVEAEGLVEGIREHGHRDVSFCRSFDEVVDRLFEQLEPGDMLITLGAGNINQVCDLLADRLAHRG
jgi:UDP-N-acetylmuramate--alanine ligase